MRRIGYEPIKQVDPVNQKELPESLFRRKQLFGAYKIDLVLDVGANIGQFGQQIRDEIGYQKKIVSFEPLSREYAVLAAKTASDSLWEVRNFALGDAIEKKPIHVAGNSYSSSILDMLPTHEDAAPESKFIDEQVIDIRTLDSVFAQLRGTEREIYLKIDTQGFEGKVLKGATNSLPLINTIQLEMSLVPLYTGELLFDDLHQLVSQIGYQLVAVEPGFADRRTGRLLQLDGIYRRP